MQSSLSFAHSKHFSPFDSPTKSLKRKTTHHTEPEPEHEHEHGAAPEPEETSASVPVRLPSSVKVGNFTLRPGKNLLSLDDSSALYRSCIDTGDFQPIRQKLEMEGFIFVRGVLNREKILSARHTILTRLQSLGALRLDGCVDWRSAPMMDKSAGWTIYAESGEDVGKDYDEASERIWHSIAQSESVRFGSFDSPELHQFYQNLFTSTGSQYHAFPDCTWLRMKGHRELTAEHTDYYYFKQNTPIFGDYLENTQSPHKTHECFVCSKPIANGSHSVSCSICPAVGHSACLQRSPMSHQLDSDGSAIGEFHCSSCANLPFPYWTCWIALGSVNSEHGRLAILPRTHQRYQGYHDMRTQLPSSIKPSVIGKQKWYSADLEPGDLILFNIKTVHAASQNLSNQFRLSCDTRVTTANQGIKKEKSQDSKCNTNKNARKGPAMMMMNSGAKMM